MHSTLKQWIGKTVCFMNLIVFECWFATTRKLRKCKEHLNFILVLQYFKVKVFENLYMLYGCKDFMS